jgi:hypothetical protein
MPCIRRVKPLLGGAGQHAAGARCERVLFEQGIAANEGVITERD